MTLGCHGYSLIMLHVAAVVSKYGVCGLNKHGHVGCQLVSNIIMQRQLGIISWLAMSASARIQ